MCAEGLDGRQGLGRRSRRGDEDQVRLEGARRQELVDQALPRAETDAAACRADKLANAHDDDYKIQELQDGGQKALEKE